MQQVVVKQNEAEQAQQKIVLDFFFEKCTVELHAGHSASVADLGGDRGMHLPHQT